MINANIYNWNKKIEFEGDIVPFILVRYKILLNKIKEA